MSAWLMLFTIARRRVDLHRRLGVFGAALALLIVGIGVRTIVLRARIAIRGASLRQYFAVFVAFDGLILVLVGVFVACSPQQRASSALHRRVMTMAIVALLPPAFGRLVAYVTHDHVEITVLSRMLLTVLFCVAIESLRSGRILDASLAPGLVCFASQRGYLRRAGGHMSSVPESVALSESIDWVREYNLTFTTNDRFAGFECRQSRDPVAIRGEVVNVPGSEIYLLIRGQNYGENNNVAVQNISIFSCVAVVPLQPC
jgi:hypothetical protein